MAKKEATPKPVRKPSPEDIGVKNDPRKKVIFYNLEGNKEDIQFSYGSENFHLFPGREATLPLCVIRHLRSLNRPIYEQVRQPNGDMITQRVGATPRFALNDVDEVPATVGAGTQTQENSNEDSS